MLSIRDEAVQPPLIPAVLKNLTNLFTLGGLFAGFYAIVQAMNLNFDLASIAIFVAMVVLCIASIALTATMQPETLAPENRVPGDGTMRG